MSFHHTFALTVLLTALPLTTAQAQTVVTDELPRPVLHAHAVETAISVDGRLDEEAWEQAEAATEFRQAQPHEGAPATQATEVRVLYGDDHLYIGAMLYDDEPDGVERTLGRRDFMNRADWFVVSIDSYFDLRTAYVFAVNAADVQFDAIRTGGGGPGGGMDESWDAVWASGTHTHAQGWSAEMRIPYSMLRFAEASESTWGIHFERRMPRRGEEVQWPLVRRSDRSIQVARYGLLRGLTGIEPRRNVQVQPYTMSRLLTDEDPDRPGTRTSQGAVDVGGDLKIGLGTNVTVDATINPDFGQIESDPAELNLTAFETFFPERRPFFIEGIQIYEFDIGRGSDLLYTRRIGGEAPIIGAAKLSGRTAGGLSFGVLGATTGEDFNPGRQYGVTRLIQQVGAYSRVGGVLTGFEGPGKKTGRIRSLAGGTDWDLRFLDNAYSLEGFAIFTHRRWTMADETPKTGLAASLRGAKSSGASRFDLSLNVFDDQFDPNDVGRLRRNNYVSLDLGTDFDLRGGQPFGPFQRAFVGFNTGQQWSYDDGLNLGMDMRLFSFVTLSGFQRVSLRSSLERPFGGYDLFETRGLGPRAQPAALELSGQISTDERRTWVLEPELSLSLIEDGGREYGAQLQANWNVGSRLSLRSEMRLTWEDDVIAWSANETFARGPEGWMIGREADPPDELEPDAYVPFDDGDVLDGLTASLTPYSNTGAYFLPVFGARDTRAFDVTARSSITFTNTLALQFYGQFFAARGRYDRFQILRDRDTLVPFSAFPKRDDFVFSSFQANTVLRWEYRPGSTLFLVWTQGRRAEDALNPLAPWGDSPYDTPVDEQFADTFRIIPSNVFIVKLNYTFLR